MHFFFTELLSVSASDLFWPFCLDPCHSLHPRLLHKPPQTRVTVATPALGAFLGLAPSSCSSGAWCSCLEKLTLTETNSVKVTLHLKKYRHLSLISDLQVSATSGQSAESVSTPYFSHLLPQPSPSESVSPLPGIPLGGKKSQISLSAADWLLCSDTCWLLRSVVGV